MKRNRGIGKGGRIGIGMLLIGAIVWQFYGCSQHHQEPLVATNDPEQINKKELTPEKNVVTWALERLIESGE